jgi:RHS repeat-associated protein
MGSSQSFSATLRDQDGNAETGVAVTFIVNGANNNLGSSVTDSTGVASYTYTGANNGSDSILATAVIIGRQVTSNAVMASWNNPVPVNPEGSVALNAPSQLGQGGLVGAFTDSNGAVIEPLAVGSSSREFLVPAGATQLQLGVDDNHYADNGGPGFVVNVNGVPLAAPIPATAMPWNWVTGAGGLNRNYQFAMNDGTSPVVAATGLTPGETVSIAYQSGTVSTNYPISPLVNADGAQTWITGTTLWQGAYFPTLYTTKSSYPLGQPITFNALVTNSSGTAMPNVSVTLNVTGANPQQLNAITDATGTATFLYSGANAGTDNLQAQALPSGEGSISSGQASVTWTSYPAPPSQAGSLALNLFGCVNNEQAYIVMAKDASTPPTPVFDANVGFYVSGADNLSLSGTTNITGQAAFGYYHANTGAYNIVAVDSANRNVVISNSVADQWSGPCVSSTNTITVGISALNTVVQSSTLALTGIVTDSANLTPQATWSQVSGPGTVTFANPTQTTSGSNPLTLQSVTTATFSQIGTYEIALSASDASGASGSSGPFTVTVVPAQQDPQGWISSPAYGSAVSGLVPITLAPGVALQSGTLTYYPANNSNADPVLNANTTGSGTIATLDTTTIPNGSYWIQLQATNTSGEAQYSLVLVTVVGNYKPGRLTTTATDLVVPSTGLAINIQRTYDSLNSGTSSDFGFGWSLGYTVDLTVDPAGDVTFTLGGQRKTFYLTPQAPSLGILGFLPWYWPVYTPEPGMHGTLKETSSSCTNDLDMIVPNGSLWVCQNGGLYTPTGYVYTDPNGTAYTIGAAGNLQSIQDLSGNGLTITPSGITSTTGLSVPFVRDSSNRITQITDPAGNIFQYAYDSNGNLATVIYPVSAQSGSACSSATAPGTSTYTYDLTFIHLYAGGTDGRGCPLPITKYYPDGRVQSATDALGETTSYAYTLSTTSTINGVSVPNTGVTTITYPTDPADGSGQPDIATMIYDSYGDLLQSTDPLGNITSNAYDVNRNLISTTDQLGKTTTYTYDSNGNRTSTTYPATATSTNTTSYATFNQYSEQTSATDELVNVRTYNYDANFNPQSTTDSLGVVATFLFNSNSTLAAGAVGYDQTANPAMASQYTYDANGNLASSTDPLGRTTSYTYDSLGRKLSMTVPTATSLTGSALSTTTYQYDALSNLIQTNAPLGSITSSTYDANGNRTSSTDLDGHVTNYIYDALNRLVETDYPSNSLTPATKTTKTYDFRNNVVKAIDQDGNVTLNAYYLDGHLKSVTRAYGSTTTTPSTTSYTYDADGRRLTETDPLGHVTTNTYDNAGHLITVATVAGSTQYAYDNAGNQISVTDPRNNTTHYQYDARKRLVTTTYPDTTTTINAYDAQGNLVSVTDQAGNVVQSYYDAARQLTSTVQVDTLNQLSYTTTYSHDDAGNQTGVTDENGHKTTSAFDALSRLTSTILPDGSLTESRYYDAAGNLTSVSHFNGVTTTFAYDALNRLLSSTTPGETTVSFTYTNTGQRATMTDASGLTQYFYDSLDRLTSKVTPAQGTLSYTYDAAGNVASIKSSNANGVWVSYTYDDMGRLGTVVDNRLQGQQTTTYSYDAASNLATAAYPNNSISDPSAFTYDSLNRLTALASPVSSYNYTLGATGNRTKAAEQGGRTLNWSYDGIYRLTNETITADPANKDGVVTYTLDSVGNRKTIASTLSGVNSGGTFSYNTDDELSTDVYDNNGDTTHSGANSFSYDSENHLMGMNAGAVTLLYDGDGNRVAKTVGGVTTRYLVDDLNPTGYPQVVDELVGGAVTRQYTFGLDRISENQFVSGAWTPSFYGIDGGGSVRQLTNSSGTVTDTYEYDAFGNKVNSTGTTPNNYLYRGEQYDPDLSLYYLRARYYNPVSGRFLNVDSLAGHGQRRYEYAGANPVDGSDPSGNFVLASYWPQMAPLTIHFAIPHFCSTNGYRNPMEGDLPPCSPPPPCHCGIKTPPEYNVAGPVHAHLLENGNMGYYFSWHASFLNDDTHKPSCCEVRQLISWNQGGSPHGGFAPPRNQPNQWYEDRDQQNKRYGRRLPSFYSDLHPGFDFYSGNNYDGNDTPQNWPPGKAPSFRLIVVDVCNGSATIYTSKTLKVIF